MEIEAFKGTKKMRYSRGADGKFESKLNDDMDFDE